ncbi:retropepsin-like aspartic protease family protein [Actimicrobium sp. CCI2.3]|uniref:retropepsin-like aspartic protease family protein n=1 Tax=Actimicrobium sp. CCI2.3 TaxID=3048616 RepID=UPI002AB3B75C|nr:TIGR02281 family clan AA aspartic protease [Actimicrobium sp. CCI2.3]MDY7575843.1 TIGR02281 family clan AA aspartic protease [Actimicrobium sp. CCI2.3]MEB0021656.1 TIGR02281 family clan AA aspartic protease [Actimicrobium sp. CCI2.3]
MTRWLLMLCLASSGAQGESIGLVGLFPGKAVLIIDGAAPRTFAVGSLVADGVRLTSVSDTDATLDDHGKRQGLAIGTHFSRAQAQGAPSITLQADSRGHFMAQGMINGLMLPMMVDTGASMVSMSAQDARRLGIDYRNGQRTFSNTANGVIPVYLVRLDNVRIGDITLSGVDALVQDQGLPFALLGMSFLNRTMMQRDGQQMVLTKRY